MKNLLAWLNPENNTVVIDTLPKARLMNKLLLAKITILSGILSAVLYLAGWTWWMLAAGAVFVAAWTVRGLRRDIRRQQEVFAKS